MVAPINKMIDTVPFNVLTYSLDWHPSDHLSFDDNVTLRKLHESSPVGGLGIAEENRSSSVLYKKVKPGLREQVRMVMEDT